MDRWNFCKKKKPWKWRFIFKMVKNCEWKRQHEEVKRLCAESPFAGRFWGAVGFQFPDAADVKLLLEYIAPCCGVFGHCIDVPLPSTACRTCGNTGMSSSSESRSPASRCYFVYAGVKLVPSELDSLTEKTTWCHLLPVPSLSWSSYKRLGALGPSNIYTISGGDFVPQGDHKKGYVQFFFLEWMRWSDPKKTSFMHYTDWHTAIST
jgi:hypothetical protein